MAMAAIAVLASAAAGMAAVLGSSSMEAMFTLGAVSTLQVSAVDARPRSVMAKLVASLLSAAEK